MTAENEEKVKPKKASDAQKNAAESSAPESGSNKEFSSELQSPQWSIVSFDRHEAENLTYEEASAKMKDLAAKNVSGLCIITDKAAQSSSVLQ